LDLGLVSDIQRYVIFLKCLLFKHEKNNQTLSNDWPTYCQTRIFANSLSLWFNRVELIHFVFCWGSFRACCILWGVPLVEDGVAIYMSIFDQPVNSEMGCSLIDICSISVLFLPNCIVKPFISFTPSVSGTTLSVPSVYFISICIYFINVPHVYILSCYACFICK
jgi:hypothetical protein